MHILLTGGTGLIGRALSQRLLHDGHQLTVLSRRPEQVPDLCGAAARGVARLDELEGQRLDAVINLAGAPIADRHWTARRKAILWESRVSLTEHLVSWLGRQPNKPEVLISGSAVGWYGDGGDKILNENSAPHIEYTHTLCDAWEAAARRAASHGIRVCLLRTGLVLAPDGGFLSRLLLPFKLGLGGPIGRGQQYMPWVHRDDMLGIIMQLMLNRQASGAYNAVAPNPVTNRAFSRSLGRALRRPALLPLPPPLLKLALGEMSRLLLTGQRAVPDKLLQQGYMFRFSELETALDDVINH